MRVGDRGSSGDGGGGGMVRVVCASVYIKIKKRKKKKTRGKKNGRAAEWGFMFFHWIRMVSLHLNIINFAPFASVSRERLCSLLDSRRLVRVYAVGNFRSSLSSSSSTSPL